MDVSPLERKVLHHWRQWQTAPPTTGSLMRASWKVLGIRALLVLLIAVVLTLTRLHDLALLATGMLIGSVVRDFDWFRRSVRTWPVLQKYLDWEKIKKGVTQP